MRPDTREALGVFAFVAALLVIAAAASARADTLPATGAGFVWQVTVPEGATDTRLTLQCWDCDVADEATLTVNDNPPLVLFGADNAANDQTVVPVTIVTALQPGANTLAFACLRRPACIRIDGIVVEYAVPVDPLRAWLLAAPAIDMHVVSREDTEPAQVIACGTDGKNRYAVALPVDLARVPAALPPTTACDLAWCFSSGPGRAAEIREACP